MNLFNNTNKILKYHIIKDKGYKKDNKFIYPYYFTTEQFQLYPYEYVDDNIKKQVINNLNEEVGSEDAYTNNYIISNWLGSNIFYVLISLDNKEFKNDGILL